MPGNKRPRVPDDQLSPQELKKRKDNTESQRRRRLRKQEKSKQALKNEQPVPDDRRPAGQQPVTLRDNISASELNVAIVEPSMEKGDSTRLYCGTLR